ncbi:MAG: hypothetical protein ACTS73_03365 [Arsenophonus sp. NEOnobi-MAG3]
MQFIASIESRFQHPLAKAIFSKDQAVEINIELAKNHKALVGIDVEVYLINKICSGVSSE